MSPRSLVLLLLIVASSCNRGGGAVRVEVRFEGFTPGCLEVTATDTATGAAESVEVLKEKFSAGKVIVGIGGASSKRLDLRVRSFERGCDGPVLEEIAREAPLVLQPRVVAEWVVELTATDADDDGFAAASANVKGTDCADTVASRYPGAPETCGALDLNCDGLAGCLDPLCVGSTCDDGVSTNTLDVCVGDGGCGGRPFTDCGPGTFVSVPGTPTVDRTCAPCASGSFSAAANAPACTSWNDCVAGQVVGALPSSTADRICVPCAEGTFSSMVNSSSCAPVGTCAAGFSPTVPPTPTSPLVCAPCTAGNYCAGGMAVALPCSAGTWDHDLNPASACVDWTACNPGFSASTLGTTTTDVVCTACAAGNYCPGLLVPPEPCAVGTWDHDANSSTACVAWTACAAETFESGAPSATSDRTCAHDRSCLERLTRIPATVTGSYVIDPDGTGPNAPITVTCNMSVAPGGWTVISFEDFATAATGWSDSRRDTNSNCTAASSAMLGGFNVFGNGASTTRVYPLLGITHTQARVALDYFIIDSWDNERARVSVDGASIFDTAFTQGGPNVCGGGFGDRWVQNVVATPAHTGANLTLLITSTLDQGAGDESWGVDNVSIMIR